MMDESYEYTDTNGRSWNVLREIDFEPDNAKAFYSAISDAGDSVSIGGISPYEDNWKPEAENFLDNWV